MEEGLNYYMKIEKTWLPTNKDIENYKLLEDLLKSQKSEFDILSKKKSNEQLNSTKIKMANRVLGPLKELFKNEESHNFLDILSEEDMPTYSDVVLIYSQYETAVREFRKKYYKNFHWITEEFMNQDFDDDNFSEIDESDR
jgi:hypothetical protein